MSKLWDSYIPEEFEDHDHIADFKHGVSGSLEYGDRGKFNTCSECGAIIHRYSHKRCNPCATKYDKKRRRAKAQALWVLSIHNALQGEK